MFQTTNQELWLYHMFLYTSKLLWKFQMTEKKNHMGITIVVYIYIYTIVMWNLFIKVPVYLWNSPKQWELLLWYLWMVYLPLWKSESVVSWDDYARLNGKTRNVPNHQPLYHCISKYIIPLVSLLYHYTA